VREDPELTAMLPGLRPARVRVTFADGRTLSAEAMTNRGDTEDPYRRDEIVEKFHELADPVWGLDRATAIRSTVLGLPDRGGARTLAMLLTR
jgi:2-methylcitrate dehydratase PrpD